MNSDPRVLKEKGDQDAINEAAKAWVQGHKDKCYDIIQALRADKVADIQQRVWKAIRILRGEA